jgi:nitrogen fixation protein NifZ
MMESRTPEYEWGQRVRAREDPHNDGSYPEVSADALLVSKGDAGKIVNVGAHLDSETPVYLVEFPRNRVVGCVEEEIAPV